MGLIYTIFFCLYFVLKHSEENRFQGLSILMNCVYKYYKRVRYLKSFFCIWTEEKAKIQVPSLKCFYSIQAPWCSEGMWIFWSVKFKRKRKIIKKCKFMAIPPFIAACGAFCGKFQNKFWVWKPEFSLQLFCLMQPFTAPGDELLLNLH